MRYLILLIAFFTFSGLAASQTQKSSPTPSGSQPEPTRGSAGTPGQYGDVQDKIQKAIQQDSSLSGANINVSVNGKKVELTGTVASKQQKKTAREIAQSNAGGMKVIDHIKVENMPTSGSTPPK